MPILPPAYQKALDRLVKRLPELLGENLYSCILYGSAVRGNVVPGVSDINLLIILNESNPDAHTAIADCLNGDIKVELFVIGRKGMERSFQAFAIKFRSIKRNYKLLCGTDPMAEFEIDDEKLRFFAEQAIRNLRLRCVHNYIYHRKQPDSYLRFLLNIDTAVFTDITEVLRLEKIEVPSDYAARIPHIEKFFNVKAPVLAELLSFKNNRRSFRQKTVTQIHQQLFGLLHNIVIWMEEKWPAQK